MDLIRSFLISFFSTVLFSILVFVAAYSIATKEFPPKLSKLKQGYDQLQNFVEMQKQLMSQIQAPNSPPTPGSVQQFIKKQKADLDIITRGDLPGPEARPKGPVASGLPIAINEKDFQIKQIPEYIEILRRLNEIEMSMNHLRTQVNNLESQQRAAVAPTAQTPVKR